MSKKYQIITSGSLENLEDKVNVEMQNGYTPSGGVFRIIPHPHLATPRGYTFAQAVYKE